MLPLWSLASIGTRCVVPEARPMSCHARRAKICRRHFGGRLEDPLALHHIFVLLNDSLAPLATWGWAVQLTRAGSLVETGKSHLKLWLNVMEKCNPTTRWKPHDPHASHSSKVAGRNGTGIPKGSPQTVPSARHLMSCGPPPGLNPVAIPVTDAAYAVQTHEAGQSWPSLPMRITSPAHRLERSLETSNFGLARLMAA